MAEQNYADILTHIFIYPLIIASFLGNLLAIIVKLHRKKKRVFNSGDLLIVNLAICDINKTWTVYITWIYSYVITDRWEHGSATCTVLQKVVIMLFSVTSLTLLLLTIERYLLIVKPFSRLFTLPKTQKLLVAMVTGIVVLSGHPDFLKFGLIEIDGKQQCAAQPDNSPLVSTLQTSYFIVVIFAPCTAIFALSGRAAATLRRSMRSCCSHVKLSHKFNEKMRRNKNAIYILRSITVGSMLCYVPWATIFVIQMMDPKLVLNTIDQTLLQPLLIWIIFGGFCNTPLTYLIFSKEFRKEIRAIVKRKNKSKSVSTRITPG